MAQEDDLRALGKIMDFMQGISVLFLLINCYWFCYSACASWHITLEVIDKNLPQLPAHYGPILFHSLDEALLCGLPCSFLLRH